MEPRKGSGPTRRTLLGAVAAGLVAAPLASGPAHAAVRPSGDSPNASPDGTTIPSAPSITDNGGNVWTVSGGVIYRNGATVGDTYNVSLLLWYGGVVYHVGTGGAWYACWNSTWQHCTDPRTPLAAPAGMMYGVNGHYDYGFTPARIVGFLQGLGCSTYRVNCTDASASLDKVTAVAQAFQGTGLTLFPVIDSGLLDSSGDLVYADESDAYSSGHSIGSTVAGRLSPYGVGMYECGNELTRSGAIILPGEVADAGTKAADFNNANWPLMRGLMRGLIDGVKSADSGALCGINFCKSDIGASDALWEGFQPDGSGGHPAVRWDLTTWHNYEGDGDIFHIGTDGAGPSFDLPIYCKARYGKPFMMTEWNSDPNQGQTHRASYIPSQLDEFLAHRSTEGFQSAMLYELTGDPKWEIIDGSGNPVQPTYSAYQQYIHAHPDV
jgi:hypothetical protein